MLIVLTETRARGTRGRGRVIRQIVNVPVLRELITEGGGLGDLGAPCHRVGEVDNATAGLQDPSLNE